MAKIINTRIGAIDANREKTPSGKEYIFYRTAPTLVTDKEDLDFFMSPNHKGAFRKITAADFAIAKVKKALGIKTKMHVSDLPHKFQKEFDAVEAKKFNKSEQIELLTILGAKNIPRYETERVTLILKLQKDVDYTTKEVE